MRSHLDPRDARIRPGRLRLVQRDERVGQMGAEKPVSVGQTLKGRRIPPQ
jgi:hypothetical protein